jgi:hypothetical protein
MVKGLSIAIENPAYTYRKGLDKTGQQWMRLMQAHYGYIQGHKGNDGDEMDVFIGNVPENDTVYIVNQKTADGYFDEHKIMLGFLSQQQAVDTYQHCFERGWTGLMSVVPCTMTQFKWWLANGDKSRPVTLDRLPYAGLERLDSVIWGGNDGSDLASHSGQVHKLLYQIRQCDDTHQALEPLSYNDLVQELGNQGFMYENYDALVVEYNKLEKKAKQLLMVMQGAASSVKPIGVTVGKPLTKGGVANVVAWFEMDDGQAVGVFFHNPDKTPKKIDPTDEMISYKWVLNKKDITIAVAPEQGKDLIIRTVAKRIMQLVEKNHDRFIKANSDKAALNQAEQDLTAQVAEKQATLKGLQGDVAVLQAKKEEQASVQKHQNPLAQQPEPVEVVTEEDAPVEENTTPNHDDVPPLTSPNTEEAEPPETDLIGDVDDGLSDHYQDDNYRFKDVGYIAGARKEKAQLAIMQAKKSGQLVSVTDIDWDALEDDSRMAAATIIKKNVFGQVDWDALKDGGMNGNVGYFIKRLYAAVELQPDDDSPESRKLYVTAIQNLRQLFESCQTMDDAVREIVALSKLLNTHRNMIKGEDGKATLNYDSQVASALGKKFKSWVFKTGNKAIHESRVMTNDDWSWLEKSDKPTVSKPKKQGFQLEAASHIQRVGGTEVSIQSTEQFKEAFGLKAIQSGNWVLKDKESIEFHIQRAAESMLDMADVTGIAPELLGFGGRLGLAFGARGKGGALAHYEPVARVINITKMKGGGSLGHEYFHALDNLIQDLVTQQNNGKAGFFATETPHLLPESLTKNAFVMLRTAMLEGDESLTETLKLTDKDFRASAYNMKPEFLERSEVKRNIAAAGNVWDAVLVVDAHFSRTRSPRPTRSSNHMDFVKIAAAHYADRNAEFVSIPSLEKGSRFLQDSLLLDDFKRGKYWSKPLEMAARAYSSYLQDKLEQQGRTNDYLAYSTKGGNGRVGEEAYPQGKERERIHAAFDDLFKAIKDEQVFEKAVGNKDLMDSVFGEDAELDDLDVLDVIEEKAEA